MQTYLVSWTRWDRTNAKWKPIYKFEKCKNIDKALRLKNNLLKQTKFVDVNISIIVSL